jgi:hypothetical protein
MAIASYALTALAFHFRDYLGLADSPQGFILSSASCLKSSASRLNACGGNLQLANRNLQPITYNRSDDAVVAAVDGDLSAGGCAEGGAAEFDDDTGHDPARYLGAENVISFIGVDR